MENKYWFMALYTNETEDVYPRIHNVVIKCDHPLLHLSRYNNTVVISWQEIEYEIALKIIKEGEIQFEDLT